MYTKEEHLLTLFGRMEAVDRLVFEQLHRLSYSPLYLYTYSLFDIQQDDFLDQKEPDFILWKSRAGQQNRSDTDIVYFAFSNSVLEGRYQLSFLRKRRTE